jgi:hypothetical protein
LHPPTIDHPQRHNQDQIKMANRLTAKTVAHLFISGDVLRVKAARPDAIVVQKPFRDTELDQAIQRTLSRQHQVRENGTRE